MFMGEYNHSIDPKGRITLPSKLRGGLGDSFIATKGLDGCLWLYPEAEWEEFSQKLRALPTTNKKARDLVRFFMSGGDEVQLDKQGRMLIAPALREYANLERDVVLIGDGNRVEIWDKNIWESIDIFDDMDAVAGALDEMGLSI